MRLTCVVLCRWSILHYTESHSISLNHIFILRHTVPSPSSFLEKSKKSRLSAAMVGAVWFFYLAATISMSVATCRFARRKYCCCTTHNSFNRTISRLCHHGDYHNTHGSTIYSKKIRHTRATHLCAI